MERPLILNRYRPLETKGKGGFSVVDVAWDTRLQRRVAIKRIPLQVDDTALPGIAEARTAALLSDAHIVSVLDFEVTGTEALLIMEHVDGPTLGALMDENEELLDLDAIATIAKAVSEALECAHENQVLHLDIKPDNVLIDHVGHVKVTDFGLAELAGTAGFAEAQGGTIGYMPPEQITAGNVDPRSDQWAFASLVYEMLTGQNPFLSSTVEGSLDRIENGEIVLPSALRDELDPEVDDIILVALSAEKERRFESVSVFYQALAPYLGNVEKGRKRLRALVSLSEDDEHPQKEQFAPAGVALWDRLSVRTRGAIGRITAAACCGFIAWLGLSAIAELSMPLGFGLMAMVALAALLAPQMGSALALIALCTGIFFMGSPLMGALAVVLSAGWWILFGRQGAADSTLPLLGPILGVAWMTPALPLLAGYFLPWKRAAAAALFGGLLMLLIAPLTGSHEIIRSGIAMQTSSQAAWGLFTTMTAEWLTWITVIGWVFAAILMSALCSRGTRVSSMLGSLLGTTVLVTFQVLGQFADAGGIWETPSVEATVSLSLSFVLLCFITFLGAPYRADEEE